MEYFKVLKIKNFSLLWLGQVCSGLGDWIYNIALLLFVADLKFSGLVVSGLMIARMLPFVLIGPFSGNYIDGKKRKQIMIISDVIRTALVILMIYLAYIGRKHLIPDNVLIGLIYLILVLSASVGTFFNPAKNAIMPQLVSKDNLEAANGLMSASNSVTLVLGPVLGGVLVALLGIMGVFWLNAFTFLFSALCIMLINVKEEQHEGNKQTENLIQKYGKGWKIISKDKLTLYYIATSAIRALVVGVVNISFIFIAERLFSSNKESLGWLYSSLGLGIILGALIIGSIKKEINRRYIFFAGIVINAMFSLLYANSVLWIMAMGSLFIIGFSDGLTGVIVDVAVQKRFKDEDLGKVFSSFTAITISAQFISMAVGGWLFDLIGFKLVISAISLLGITLSVITFILYNRKIEI